MIDLNSKIKEIDQVICNNINSFSDNQRGLLSQNILSQLRNFVECIAIKIYSENLGSENNIELTYENITYAIEYIKARGDLKFLRRFHRLLQITVSHFTLDEENSERLMLKYFEYLFKTRHFLKSSLNIDVLHNLDDFPIHQDSNLLEYYKKITEKLNQPSTYRRKSTYNDRYYIQKIKPFFIDKEVYYEVTFTRAFDYISKFDRIIAFTKHNINKNYAVKLTVSTDTIDVIGRQMPIQIIDNWEVSIRPCELNNFAKIFGHTSKISGTKESYNLMRYLTNSGLNIVELIDLSNYYYDFAIKNITSDKNSSLIKILNRCRRMSQNKQDGCNVIRYLLYRLNNKLIKKQYKETSCHLLSHLRLQYGCIPFDQMPFNTALINHNPKLSDLFECIEIENRQHELFARLLKNNTELKGQLYTPLKEIEGFENKEELIIKWNSSLYSTHGNRKIETYKSHLYIEEYENDTSKIIGELTKMSSSGIRNFSNSVDSWLNTSSYSIDSDEKKIALTRMFENSKVALIYGAAGTGKSTMINHISNFFNDDNKLYLANTNPAVDNLKRRVNASNCTFQTIAKFKHNSFSEYDILIIDECSTVNNADILEVINKANYKLLVLVGDTFQIESILFGNWFSLAKAFVPNSSVFELTTPYRSNNSKLLELWNRVRDISDNTLEHITKNDYSITLNESVFEEPENDEIILCLNYDGLYGINNINAFLQNSNPNPSIIWGTHTYKVNDPIIFNESRRYAPLIYNNLKGRIMKITTSKDKIEFDTEIDMVINEFDAMDYDFEMLENSDNGKSVIRFTVDRYKSTDEDDDEFSSKNVIPFQIAYAVSIHKAQGLEYSSVKIVITDEVEEMISHNIFYTAITRAKDKLKIYWTPETEKTILESLEKKSIGKDLSLLKSKYNFSE